MKKWEITVMKKIRWHRSNPEIIRHNFKSEESNPKEIIKNIHFNQYLIFSPINYVHPILVRKEFMRGIKKEDTLLKIKNFLEPKWKI